MLTFISFWRAAAIVLCDLGSSAFCAGGIAERAIGKAARGQIIGDLRKGPRIPMPAKAKAAGRSRNG
jgi:hypothetical protein